MPVNYLPFCGSMLLWALVVWLVFDYLYRHQPPSDLIGPGEPRHPTPRTIALTLLSAIALAMPAFFLFVLIEWALVG